MTSRANRSRNNRCATALLVATTLVLAACKAQAPTPQPEPATPQVTADTSAQPARSTDAPLPSEDASLAPAVTTPALPSAFVDKVWKVSKSGAVEPGTTYVFLADGTLVIDSPNGTPMHGRWSFDKGALVMVEEGISYPTEIIAIDDSQFHIRSHNPGEPVDIELVPAPDQPLPKP
ncbi:hypothetical protein MNR01_13730 [Lysobacter sp. S4-A87]|uniref:hypothetical protein n=1 Tax=Lysobacter sp. S4-A87 TaxID=2925843 RepID=UPI001F53DAFB|nr:hypothetical protein [Lysobacter sp. S4-A87]UNK48793.1 hypothetical protein MNR01_13730 [Lysobacter sp. S4-A87]